MNNLLAAAVDWSSLEQQASPNIAGKPIGFIVSEYLLPWTFRFSGIVMLFYLIYAGYQYMVSSGDPKALQQSRMNITYAIIGFLIIFTSYWVIKLFGVSFSLLPIVNIFY
jgi:hypothetical protein